ncbi:unnamed protein product [Clonostachys solani]|uniref:Structure-specific endonuclease subunit SLX4 n=1 Tax=Clonostachys solani TaxID=160281 RepID=A0A9N9ZJ22_9HYPO|nr:unnamed protein product [Clonostachys solani]
MASHNAFTSPSRQATSRDAFVIESSSPDLPPFKDLLSQTSNASKQLSKGTTRKGSDITASKPPATTKERKRPNASTSKYWKLTSSIETPVVIDDTPPTEKYHNSRVQFPNESSKPGPSDVLGQGHRSPDQPWKAYKISPPRIEMEGGIMSRPPRFVSNIPDSEDCVVMVDENSKSIMEGQPLETPKSHPEKMGAKEDPSLPLNLEQAVARRLDWTPPETKKAICDNLASVFEIGTSPFRDEEQVTGLKTILAGCGYEAPEENYRPIPNAENSGFLNKRKLIELVPATSANSTTPEPQEESPTKPKAPKKKPRTITELATAAYKLPTNDVVAEASATVAGETESKSTDLAGPTANGKAKSKPRKKAAKPAKKREPKKAVLLSPNTALKAAENQNFLFGTSSQLAREQSPTLLRQIQAAMKSSVEFDDSHILDVPVNSDLVEPQVQKPKLWEAAARNLDGDLFDVEIVDLVGNPSSPPQSEVPKDPFGYIGAENEPSLPPLSGITTDRVDETFETLSDILPPTNPKVSVPEDEPSPFSSRQVIDTDGQKPKDVPGVQSGKTSSSASKLPSTGFESNTPQDPEATPPCPSYELFTDAQLAKEFASYGFKPVKKRAAMISLLEQCWRSKVGGAGTSARTLTTSATAFHPRGNPSQVTEKPPSPKRPRGRPRKSPTPTMEHEQVPPPSGQPPSSPPKPRKATRKPKSSAASLKSKQPVDAVPTQESPKRGRGRPRKSPPVGLETGSAAPKPKSSTTRTVIEIPDSESDNDDNSSISSSSSPELTSSPPPMPMDLSASINEDTELSLSVSNSEDEASLFEYISTAVVTAPRSTDPANPSWHEKILLYDPIVLEDLTAWLNLGQLTRVGRDTEVSPGEVKKWCESKSICCLWRVNLRGKERKRY